MGEIRRGRYGGGYEFPYPGNAIAKQIAATALTYELTLVTRNKHDGKSGD